MPTPWIALLAFMTVASPAETDETSQGPSANPPIVAGQQSKSEKSALESHDLSSERLRKRTGRELLVAVRETLARLADPENEHLEAAAEELLFVYEELHEDRDMAGSQREYYVQKVGRRLEQLSVELKKRIARNKRLDKSKAPDRIQDLEKADATLAQRAGGAAPPARPLVGGGAAGVGQRMPNDDYGQHLVELIQTTVAPSTWDVSGGLGTIYYWRPGRALVVRQTGEVHDQMGGVLGQLRRAGQ